MPMRMPRSRRGWSGPNFRREKLDQGVWGGPDDIRNRMARNRLQELQQEAAAKVKTKRRDRVSMYLLIATLVIAVIAGIAFYWPRLFSTPVSP